MRAIGSAPDEPFSQIYVTLISAINSAESEILLTNAYFVPDPQLMQALIGAAARGVDVKLIVPSTTDSSLVFHAGRSHYEPLLRGGVKIYERREALLHAKTARHRRRLGDGRLDQPRLAQLPAQPGVDRRHSRRGIRREDARSLRARPGRVRSDHTRGLAAAAARDARQGNVRSTVGVLAVSISCFVSRPAPPPALAAVGRARCLLAGARRRTPPRCAHATRRCRTSSPTTSSAGRSCSSRPRPPAT